MISPGRALRRHCARPSRSIKSVGVTAENRRRRSGRIHRFCDRRLPCLGGNQAPSRDAYWTLLVPRGARRARDLREGFAVTGSLAKKTVPVSIPPMDRFPGASCQPQNICRATASCRPRLAFAERHAGDAGGASATRRHCGVMTGSSGRRLFRSYCVRHVLSATLASGRCLDERTYASRRAARYVAAIGAWGRRIPAFGCRPRTSLTGVYDVTRIGTRPRPLPGLDGLQARSVSPSWLQAFPHDRYS